MNKENTPTNKTYSKTKNHHQQTTPQKNPTTKPPTPQTPKERDHLFPRAFPELFHPLQKLHYSFLLFCDPQSSTVMADERPAVHL